jgi:lambda family phage portal protein
MVMGLKNTLRRFLANYLEPAYTTTGWGERSRRWRGSPLGPNAALDQGLVTLRNQSRDSVRKNPLAYAALERIRSNVVGTGIKPQLTDSALMGLWNKWTDEAAADGQLDFYGLQSQVMDGVVTAGEVFVRKRIRFLSDGLSVPLQIEVLEGEFVPMWMNQTLANGNTIRQGIEFDAKVRSRRVAYYMHSMHPNDPGAIAVDNTPKRVDAREVCHVYLPTRPGQVRGEPWMARVLDRLIDVEEYDKAELVRKKVSAMFTAFLRRNLPADMTIDDLEQIWGDKNADINGAMGQVTLAPGLVQTLLPGEDVVFAEPKDVGSQYETFLRQQHRAIAAGMGILYEQLTGDYSQMNDRTWRAAVNEFRRRCEMWQHHLIVFQFCRPVFDQWFDLAVLSGAATAPAEGERPTVKWMPPAWPYINPVQDVQAMRELVRGGFSTRSEQVSLRGYDSAQIDDEQSEDNKRADKLGLVYDSDARVAVSKGASPNSTGTEDPSVDPNKVDPEGDDQEKDDAELGRKQAPKK